jgi:hypothetical protein
MYMNNANKKIKKNPYPVVLLFRNKIKNKTRYGIIIDKLPKTDSIIHSKAGRSSS